MTDQIDISPEAVERLLDGVTPGPWRYEAQGGSSTVLAKQLPPRNDRLAECSYGYGDNGFCIAYPFRYDDQRIRFDFVSFGHSDARFIAAARQLVPALSAERDRLTAENAALRDALEFYAPRTIDGITFTGNDDAGIRARAALDASQPRKTDTNGV